MVKRVSRRQDLKDWYGRAAPRLVAPPGGDLHHHYSSQLCSDAHPPWIMRQYDERSTNITATAVKHKECADTYIYGVGEDE